MTKDEIELSNDICDKISQYFNDYDGEGYIAYDKKTKSIRYIEDKSSHNENEIINPISNFITLCDMEECVDYRKVDELILGNTD